MSDEKSTDNNLEATEDAQFPEPEDVPEAAPRPAPKKRANGIAWLALLLAAVAVAAAGLDFVRDRSSHGSAARETAQLDADLRSLTTSLGATQGVVASLEQSVSALEASDASRESAIASLQQELDDRLRRLQAMPGRISSIEASLASLQGISTGARDAWLIAEAEYYMQLANVQLQLARNPELALLALNHADDRILQLADPRLTNVRQALANEKRALESMEKTDTAGITLTLASLATTVDSLPLKQESAAAEEASSQGIDPELTGMDRAMASLRNAVDGIVSVRRTDESIEPLMAPEARYFIRANLALQLQAARLALLRGEETVFRQSLQDVNQWLGEYYDADSAAVQSARREITEMRDSVIAVAAPDISRSLRLLRQFNALNDAAASGGSSDATAATTEPEATPEPEPEPDPEPDTEPEQQ